MSNIINDTLELGNYYHIYNRGVNSCDIFKEDENYFFFLSKFSNYLLDFVDVYAYCLMPNHFHILIKVNDSLGFVKVQNFDKALKDKGLHAEDAIVSKQFAKFFSSYTQAFNKFEDRHGPLLESPFKRKRIKDEEYMKNLILYIHHNPMDIHQNFKNYKFSSYKAIISELKTNINKQKVLDLFGGLENFVHEHRYPSKFDFKF